MRLDESTAFARLYLSADPLFFPEAGKKSSQYRAALALHDPAGYGERVVEAWIVAQLIERLDRAALGIEAAEDQPRDARL